jgi:hypothetical protein
MERRIDSKDGLEKIKPEESVIRYIAGGHLGHWLCSRVCEGQQVSDIPGEKRRREHRAGVGGGALGFVSVPPWRGKGQS